MKIIKVIIVLIFSLFFIAHFGMGKAWCQEEPRTDVVIIKRLGEQKEFDSFRKILKDRVREFREEFGKRDGFSYINDLRIKEAGIPKNFEAFWRTEDSSLVLSYSVASQKNDRIFVASEIYLYELKGKLARNQITIEQEYSTHDFRFSRDVHSMVTLYALAMDAKRRRLPSYVILEYLQKAYAILNDIPQRTRSTDINELFNAVSEELKSLQPKVKGES